ncbi:MAG: TlpA family protein disulfide reductase, partial [Chloroflexi bacterium]|nr:TlpA family protein disulfide reductase [Chloroflexota bacterium]
MAQLVSQHIEVADDFDAVQRLYLERGWTDGLPIVPPTPGRIESMVQAAGLDPQHVVAEIPPNYGAAT